MFCCTACTWPRVRWAPIVTEFRSKQVTVELIHGTLTWISPVARRLLEVIITARGLIRGADSLARALGFRNRHQLKRQLEREGLPNLEVLCGWIRVLLWVEEWERAGVALSRGALRTDTDPAVRFRCVKRITGHSWSNVRGLGSTWVVFQLLERCRKPPQGQVSALERSA